MTEGILQEPSITLVSVLILFGSAQGIFLSLVLFTMRTGSRTAHRFLAALLLVFSCGLVDGFLSVTSYYLRYPSLIAVYWPLQFAYGPLVYLYVKSLTVPQWNMQRWKVSVHFLPIILYALYLVPFYLLDAEIKSQMWLVGHSRLRTYNTNGNPVLAIRPHAIACLCLSCAAPSQGPPDADQA